MKKPMCMTIDPKSLWKAELRARKHRDSLTGTLRRLLIEVINDPVNGVKDLLDQTWEHDEKVRIRKLEKFAPDLLLYDEEVWLKREKEDINQ